MNILIQTQSAIFGMSLPPKDPSSKSKFIFNTAGVKCCVMTVKLSPRTLKQDIRGLPYSHFDSLLAMFVNYTCFYVSFRAYLKHISLVDKGVKTLVENFNKYYNDDGKTAYVFTSDHGMTDWGKAFVFILPSWKNTYIILTLLNPTFL